MSNRIDWPAVAPDVVTALLGEPNRKLSRGARWRYGSKGSLSVDLDKAAWFDFEAEQGGKLSKLIEREKGCDWKGARRWLEVQGFVKPWRPDPSRRRSGPGQAGAGRRHARAPKGAPGGAETPSRAAAAEHADRDRRIALARALWSATKPVPSSPVAAYLARRGTWPAREIGRQWPMVPPAVAWIDREALLRADAKLAHDFPGDAAGAMAAAFLPAGELVNPALPHECRPVAVSLDALKADGSRPSGERWRKTRGVDRGAACSMPASLKGGSIALVEGECDALAVALMARAGLYELGDVAEVRCVGGTSGLAPDRAADRDGRPVLLLPDGPGNDGGAGAYAKAVGCATRLRADGRTARVRCREDGDEAGDPAGDLAVLLMERAGRFERGGTAAEQARADRQAWRALLGLDETED